MILRTSYRPNTRLLPTQHNRIGNIFIYAKNGIRIPNPSVLAATDTLQHSVEQKSIGLIFRTSRSGRDVRYSCHHIRVVLLPHICAFVAFLCLQFITIKHTAYMLTEDNNTFAYFEIKTLIKLHYHPANVSGYTGPNFLLF
jgi:hypothetical protein